MYEGSKVMFTKKMKIDHANGKEAFSHFFVLSRFSNFTLLSVKISTGRTHQIRVHLAHLGYPILGDDLYGGHSDLINRQCLHASHLEFNHPKTGERIVVDAPLAGDISSLIDKLKLNI